MTIRSGSATVRGAAALLALAVFGGVGPWAGEPPAEAPSPPVSLPKPPPETGDGLPSILARYPGGLLTRARFREQLARRLPGELSAFDLPETFLNAEMLRRERARLHLPPPDPVEADVRMKLTEKELGGRGAMAEKLASVRLTLRDAWRLALRDAEFADVGRHHLKPPPRGRLTEREFDVLRQLLRRRYRPQWYGLETPLRIARVGDGENLTLDELLDFVVREGNDLPLRQAFDEALMEELWAKEAARLGIPNTPDALAAHFLRQATPEKAAAFYREHAGDMALTQMSWILLTWPRPEGEPPVAAPDEAARKALFVDALRLRADIQGGRMSFAEAARVYSKCPVSASRGGTWGFVPGADWVAQAVDPLAWRLDSPEVNGRKVSPVVPAPDPEVAKRLPALKDLQLSDPLPLTRGYALVLRQSYRPPPPEPHVREALRRWLTATYEIERRRELFATAETLWSPESR